MNHNIRNQEPYPESNDAAEQRLNQYIKQLGDRIDCALLDPDSQAYVFESLPLDEVYERTGEDVLTEIAMYTKLPDQFGGDVFKIVNVKSDGGIFTVEQRIENWENGRCLERTILYPHDAKSAILRQALDDDGDVDKEHVIEAKDFDRSALILQSLNMAVSGTMPIYRTDVDPRLQ